MNQSAEVIVFTNVDYVSVNWWMLALLVAGLIASAMIFAAFINWMRKEK